MTIRIETAGGPLLRAKCAKRLHEHARREAPAVPGPVQAIDLLARDESGREVGLLCGRLAWGVLEIDALWVDPPARGRGAGGHLLRGAEERARQAGCDAVLVSTYDFQAPGFYRRAGFREVGRMDTRGRQRIIFSKSLNSQ